MTKLTSNEIKALTICLNYNDRETQLADNYSNGGLEEFMDVLKWNEKQAAALIGSLEKKGMGTMDKEDNIFWLSEAGVNTIFDIIENEE